MKTCKCIPPSGAATNTFGSYLRSLFMCWSLNSNRNFCSIITNPNFVCNLPNLDAIQFLLNDERAIVLLCFYKIFIIAEKQWIKQEKSWIRVKILTLVLRQTAYTVGLLYFYPLNFFRWNVPDRILLDFHNISHHCAMP